MKSFREFIQEMATNLGYGYAPLDNNRSKDWYSKHSESPEYKGLDFSPENKDVKIHKVVVPGKNTKFITLDHGAQKTLHFSSFSHKGENDWLDEPHMIQMDVHSPKSEHLPKGHASKIFMHHIETTEMPHVSSDTQYEDGHKMWRGLAKRALDSGYHVYHHNGEEIEKTTKNNIEKHLDNSFGDDEDANNRHMIISKYPLIQRVKE